MAKAPIDIRSLARAHTDRAIQVLAGIMDQPDCPPAARVAAATSLLDRGWGKPKQINVNADASSEEGRQLLGWEDDAQDLQDPGVSSSET